MVPQHITCSLESPTGMGVIHFDPQAEILYSTDALNSLCYTEKVIHRKPRTIKKYRTKSEEKNRNKYLQNWTKLMNY